MHVLTTCVRHLVQILGGGWPLGVMKVQPKGSIVAIVYHHPKWLGRQFIPQVQYVIYTRGGLHHERKVYKRSVFAVYTCVHTSPFGAAQQQFFHIWLRYCGMFAVRQNLHRCGRHCRYRRNAVPSSWQVEGEVDPGHAEGCLWYWWLADFCFWWVQWVYLNQQIIAIQQLDTWGLPRFFGCGPLAGKKHANFPENLELACHLTGWEF